MNVNCRLLVVWPSDSIKLLDLGHTYGFHQEVWLFMVMLFLYCSEFSLYLKLLLLLLHQL